MHDCPGCQTPLHGHESFCPVCGVKQNIRPESQPSLAEQYKKPYSPLLFLVLVVVIVGGVAYALQNSWVGQLIKRGPIPEEETLSPQAARAKIESTITQNLAQQSVTAKFSYTADDKPVDINYPKSVSLSIDVNLKHPEERKSIVEPIKNLMAPANINTITLNDEHSHATVTLTLPPESGANNADTTNGDDQSNGLSGSQQ